MAKSAFKTFLVSFLALSFLSCTIKPTYSLQEINQEIKDICREEFNIDVKVWLLEDTVWVYAPFEELVSEEGRWNEKASEDIKNIFLTLSRVFLNIDKPPEFYCLAASNIKGHGADAYFMGFIPDVIKFQMGFISLKEREERVVFRPMFNPAAIGDKEGKHIIKHNVTMGDFIAFLARQEIEKKFISAELKDFFQINELYAYYGQGRLEVTLDIEPLEQEEGSSPAAGLSAAAEGLKPFEEAKKTIKKFLSIYCPCPDIIEIEINDTFNNKNRIFSKKALLESN